MLRSRRSRPNVVLDLDSREAGFGEDGWPGKTLRIGDEVCLRVTDPVARCVMTTLPQADLPKDRGIVDTTSRYDANNASVYAQVSRGGRGRLGDRFVLV